MKDSRRLILNGISFKCTSGYKACLNELGIPLQSDFCDDKDKSVMDIIRQISSYGVDINDVEYSFDKKLDSVLNSKYEYNFIISINAPLINLFRMNLNLQTTLIGIEVPKTGTTTSIEVNTSKF